MFLVCKSKLFISLLCLSWGIKEIHILMVEPSFQDLVFSINILYFPLQWEEELETNKYPSVWMDLYTGFPSDSVVKNPPVMQETHVQFLGQEDPLEKEMATHSSILAWRIPWTEEPGGLHFIGSSQRVRHDWATNTFTLSLFLWKGKRLFSIFLWETREIWILLLMLTHLHTYIQTHIHTHYTEFTKKL